MEKRMNRFFLRAVESILPDDAEMTEGTIAILNLAEDVDRLRRYAAELSRTLADRLSRHANDVDAGFRGELAIGSMTDLERTSTELVQKQDMLLMLVRIFHGTDAAKKVSVEARRLADAKGAVGGISA